ncbi:MAG: hypothetical protein PHZ26_05130 [Candidatus Gracilibacteria bacterium]|nr:hypothetical protein [Candidatus Gracilibacteria bacterium]MDD2909101.1 hypothetical protein [Candidatus Gracilibacteria bacterium]
MSLFDFMGDEKATTTTDSSSGTQSTGTGGDDTSFLIIDDSNNISSETMPLITANDIPDSAISFFEEAPVVSESIFATETPSVKEETLSFFDEEPTILESSDENLIINEEPTILESSDENLIINEEPTDITEFPAQEESSFLNAFEEIVPENKVETNSEIVPEKEIESIKTDPNSILVEAIANLQSLEKGYENIINEEMNIIEGKQSQIANLKQEIKASTEKAKTTGEEKNKVLKMIELFQSQKI